MLLERWNDPRAVKEEVAEFLERLQGSAEPAATRVRRHLKATAESVGIELKASDARGMGWPVAIAVAAEICERFDGILHADGSGWMAPSGIDVDLVLPDRA